LLLTIFILLLGIYIICQFRLRDNGFNGGRLRFRL
jgi:hypothetical protein